MATFCGAFIPDKNGSGDAFYGPLICNNTMISYFWSAYGFVNLPAAEGGWRNGWGYEASCNTSLPLARTFTGLYALTYSAFDWPSDTYDKPLLNCARRYVREQIRDLRAICYNQGFIAATFSGAFVVDRVELYRGYWYSQAVVERASTLVHEARHMGGKDHDANFPAGSTYGAGKSGGDSSWEYQGAWQYEANYLWWFYAAGVNTTSAMKSLARLQGNIIIDNAFAKRPAFHI